MEEFLPNNQKIDCDPNTFSPRMNNNYFNLDGTSAAISNTERNYNGGIF